MKKTNLILILLIVFAVFVCTTGVASAALFFYPKYVGNTVVDLGWSKYPGEDFSCYKLYRNDSKIATISDRNTTFYRDTGPGKGVMYYYKIEVYNRTGVFELGVFSRSVTTGKVHGTITQDITWTAGSYNLTDDVTVEENATLTIYGVTVTKGYSGIRSVIVYGTLSSGSATFDRVNIQGERGSRHLSVKNCLFNSNYTFIYLYGNDSSAIGNTFTGRSGIEIFGCNNSVKNNILIGIEEIGISLSNAYGNTITGNIVSNGYEGILISDSSNNTLTGNTANNNSNYGIRLDDGSSNNTLMNNTVLNNSGSGISLGFSSSNTFTGNTVSNNSGSGISLGFSSSNTFTGNTVSNNSKYGISLSNNCTLTGNTVSNNGFGGIRMSSGYYTLTGNTVSNNTGFGGIYMDCWWGYSTLTGNTVVSNNGGYGIFLSDTSSNNTLMNNTVSNNRYGIVLSNNCTFTGNTVVSNNGGYGIYLRDSSNNNTIYNNYFNNTNNARDGSNNTWNITKTPGLNIAGGPYLGGNCWSDYVGNDTDGDRLGDTLLPYNRAGGIENGGDYHPLICEPIDVSVSDIIAKVLVDGENATVNATVHTDAGLFQYFQCHSSTGGQ